MLRYSAVFLLLASAAQAQDALTQARDAYGALQGEWAEPSKDCSDPADTWEFGLGGVRAGFSQFELLGIGGGQGSILVDLVNSQTGGRVPLNLVPGPIGLEVNGSGISVLLSRCDEPTYMAEPQIAPPPLPPSVTSQSLDDPAPGTGDLPTTEELRQALGQTTPPPAPPLDGEQIASLDTDPVDEGDVSVDAETAFANRFSGAYSSNGGACDWRLSDNGIVARGESYEVVNFSGSPDRIGVQALRSDGSPATFTITPTGSGAEVSGTVAGGDSLSASLSPC